MCDIGVKPREWAQGTPDDFVASLVGLVGTDTPLLLARGRLRANPDRGDFAALRLDTLELLHRAWVLLEDQAGLTERLRVDRTLRVGGWSGGKWAWTTDGPPMIVGPVGDGLRWHIGAEELVATGHRQWVARVAAVQAYVGDDWVEQGVRLRLHDGLDVVIASQQNRSVLLDWGYDGVSLAWDTAWCQRLARAIAQTLGVPFEDAV